jgi:hypothetical protein
MSRTSKSAPTLLPSLALAVFLSDAGVNQPATARHTTQVRAYNTYALTTHLIRAHAISKPQDRPALMPNFAMQFVLTLPANGYTYSYKVSLPLILSPGHTKVVSAGGGLE